MRKLSRWLLMIFCAIMAISVICACTATGDDNTYHVTFNLGYPDASEAEVVNVESGATVARPADPTRDHYSFDAWYTEVACVNKYNFESAVTGSFTLFAGWTQTVATVTYETGEGSSVADETVSVGDTLARPTVVPTLEGYAFGGWYVEPLCREGYEYDFSATVESDLTLYAKWTQTEAIVTLALYDNITSTVRVSIGEKLDPSDLETPERENYVFTAWYTDAQRTREYDFDTVVYGNLTLYAGWKLTKATITYNFNYESAPAAETAVVDAGAPFTPIEAPDREGYDLTGWYTDAACTREFDFGKGTDEDITLYAGWELKTYTVTFDWNFEGSVPTTAEVKHGATIVEPTEIPQNGDKILVGWTTDREGERDFDTNTRITGDLTLYAKWQDESSDRIVIRFYDQGRLHETNDTAIAGRYLDKPADPVRSGYYFAGWARGSETGVKWNFDTDRVSSSVDLYAVWLKGYAFEAEYTELDGKYYSGWSNDGIGPASTMVADANNYTNAAEMKVSGGYYVYSMLYNGAFLEFNIRSEKAVNDAVLVLRLAPDGFSFELDDESYQVTVNGTRLQYGMLCIPIGQYRTDDMSDSIKPPFFNYLLTDTLSLHEGDNIIRLETNNTNEHGGTFNAETPSVDCLTIYSSSTLTWTPGKVYPENIAQLGHPTPQITYAVEYEGNYRVTYMYEHYDADMISVMEKIDLMIPVKKEKRYE